MTGEMGGGESDGEVCHMKKRGICLLLAAVLLAIRRDAPVRA